MIDRRLYTYFRPQQYNLRLHLERAKRRFNGTVAISGLLTEAAGSITLHAHKLHITETAIDGRSVTFESGPEDALVLHHPGLPDGEHTVTITFEGKISDPMHGLYPCYFTLDGQPEELLATMFESHHAREVFPCIDEPEAKATFELTLDTEPGITTISNTPIKQQLEENDRLITTFETTPVMSTYLLAWVVGNLDHKEAVTKDGVLVRAYATPDKKAQLQFALETAVKSLEFYNDYFDLPYPLPKCDLVALPDFSAGAMENWGCITFRENALLVDEHTSTSIRQYVATVITHELAHQWFGDLVTMKWWDDLWLNESFANWIEYLATDHLFPEWNMWTQYFEQETSRAFARDSLASVQKIQQKVQSVAEIHTLFDGAIVYAKGGSLLNMLHAYLGADVFRDGLRLYLARFQYKNAEDHDLWAALGEVSHKDVSTFMKPWITQAGLPVVTVGDSSQTITLHQDRFFAHPQQTHDGGRVSWPIPLLSNHQLELDLLKDPSATSSFTPSDTPLLLNQGRTGYYISLYSTQHMHRLGTAIGKGQLSISDRLGLLDDSLNLSKAGLLPYVSALQLLSTYQHESSYPVWGAITNHLRALKMFAENDGVVLEALRNFTKKLASEQFLRLGLEPIEREPYFDELLRPLIVDHMAYAEDALVIDRLQNIFREADAPADIWANIRSITCATAAAFDEIPTFTKLLRWYQTTTSAAERVQIIAGFAGLRNPKLLGQALDLLTTDAVKLQDLYYWIISFSRSPYARELLWQWVKQQWPWIADKFDNDMRYSDFPKYTASGFSTRSQLEAYKTFFESKQQVEGLGRAIEQGIEDIEIRVLWRERDGNSVATYLQGQR